MSLVHIQNAWSVAYHYHTHTLPLNHHVWLISRVNAADSKLTAPSAGGIKANIVVIRDTIADGQTPGT